MSTLSVLPNFTILMECEKDSKTHIEVILSQFCEELSRGEYVASFRITPSSYWKGLNTTQNLEVDLVSILIDNAKEEVPENVIQELQSFKSKFGKVTLVGDDALLVSDNDLLEELKNSSTLKNYFYNICGNMIFFSGITANDLKNVFEHEFGHPIKSHVSKVKTYILWDGYKRYMIKANNELKALKSIYNKHPFICEESLRRTTNNNKKDLTDSDVEYYLRLILNDPQECPCKLDFKEITNDLECLPLAI